MRKILLVEDDGLMARMYQRVFSHEGYSVEVAKDGQEGWERIAKNPPDLILLDVMMPKLNGLELLAKIKENEKTKAVKVVLLTNLGVQEEIDKALKNGAVKYLAKSDHSPADVAVMVKAILGPI